MTDAPFYSEISLGPDGGYARWITASDGVRLRAGFWPNPSAQRTILILNGRTEYIEKYGHIAAAFHSAGYAVATLDWRGQGLSDRLTGDPLRGHVGTFNDYQKDLQALLRALNTEGLPPAHGILAHSMGGCIGLRALIEGLDVKGAVFSAPMWNILMARYMRPVAWTLARAAQAMGKGTMLTPGTNPGSFILSDPFEDNTLTRDAGMWAHMAKQIETIKGVELGGPSIHWVGKAMTECAELMRLPAPDVPALTFLGDNERIVDATAIHRKMDAWHKGRLRMVPEAEHEAFMEGPEKRAELLSEAIEFLDAL